MQSFMKLQLLLFMGIIPFMGNAQPALEAYLQQALQGNIALQQEQLSLEKSLAALQEAKQQFLPTLSVQARYSVADGGRAFTIPVGDLVNPVYQNLNALNEVAQSATPDYPTVPDYPMIDNVEENFLRSTEQETVVRLQMPVFNQAILRNQRIQENLSEASRLSVDQYKRALVKEVKVAYYSYLQAREGLQIVEEAQALLRENLRTTQSLEAHHKVTKDAVYRAQAELSGVEQQIAEARQKEKVAQAYFNFLLNRPYDANIETLQEVPAIAGEVPGLEAAQAKALRGREELERFSFYEAARHQQVALAKGQRLPVVNLRADYGIQGTGYEVDDGARFFLGALVMSVPLFDAKTSSRIQQAKIGQREVEQQRRAAEQQLRLQVVKAYYELEAAREQIQQAEDAHAAAEQGFRLVRKKYEQGQANLLEFQQSRNQMTTAALRASVAQLQYHVRLAVFEQATVAYPIP